MQGMDGLCFWNGTGIMSLLSALEKVVACVFTSHDQYLNIPRDASKSPRAGEPPLLGILHDAADIYIYVGFATTWCL